MGDDTDRDGDGGKKSRQVQDQGDLARRNAEERRARAAATLRENLLRRKQQGRARRAGAADETSGLPAVKSNESDD